MFYSRYKGNLTEITLLKLKNNCLSQKLRKLSFRNELLPEEGDMKLIADAIKLRNKGFDVCIYSNDRDLWHFSSEIEKEFSIKVVK
jgi:hypothetical protein